MTIVADASLVLKWVLHEEHTEDALALRDHWRDTGELLVAPPIFRSEVTNVLYRRARRGEISQSDALEALDAVLSLVEIDEPPDLYKRAILLAGELKLGSTYDALYLSLAEARRCFMWTADLHLVRSVRPQFAQIRWLAEAI